MGIPLHLSKARLDLVGGIRGLVRDGKHLEEKSQVLDVVAVAVVVDVEPVHGVRLGVAVPYGALVEAGDAREQCAVASAMEAERANTHKAAAEYAKFERELAVSEAQTVIYSMVQMQRGVS